MKWGVVALVCVVVLLPHDVFSGAAGGNHGGHVGKRSVDYDVPDKVVYADNIRPRKDKFKKRYKSFLRAQKKFGKYLGYRPAKYNRYNARRSKYMQYLLANGYYNAYEKYRTPTNSLWKKYGYSLFGEKTTGDRYKRAVDGDDTKDAKRVYKDSKIPKLYGYGGYNDQGIFVHGDLHDDNSYARGSYDYPYGYDKYVHRYGFGPYYKDYDYGSYYKNYYYPYYNYYYPSSSYY
eukprot:TRINITY_DN473_c0_g1_i1.p1 TRINITY_DN473_c0_g1~~TRINITY_DN473_c0_g1_i1.p1  ORF type:complete len:233 (-),score=11.22 TRINITY_DN473_c0_g1_i1:72-770(-)